MRRPVKDILTAMLVALGVMAVSCGTSRSTTVTETSAVTASAMEMNVQGDSGRTGLSVTLSEADTLDGLRRDCGRIDISRDSAGRPVTVIWSGLSVFGWGSFRQTDYGMNIEGFRLRSAGTYSEADSSATDTHSDTVAVAESPLDRLERHAGAMILAVTLVYMAGTLLPKLWKK